MARREGYGMRISLQLPAVLESWKKERNASVMFTPLEDPLRDETLQLQHRPQTNPQTSQFSLMTYVLEQGLVLNYSMVARLD